MKLRELQERWPHLSDLLTEIVGTQVNLLFGSDVAELIVRLEIWYGPKGCPVGVHARIGWTVTGHVPGYIQRQESLCKVRVGTPDEELNETVKMVEKLQMLLSRSISNKAQALKNKRG